MSFHILTPEDEEQIVYLYSVQKLSIAKIKECLPFVCDARRISKVLDKHNIVKRTNEEYRKLPIDESYFETINDQRKAYLLGYIYADGCIYYNKRFKLTSSEENIEALQILKQELKAEREITDHIKGKGSYAEGKPGYEFCFTNSKICNDLKQLGVKENKTFTIEFPTKEQLPEEFERHFIRGYFDGNGSIYSVFNKKWGKYEYTVSFSAGSKNILIGIQQRISLLTGSKANIYPYKNRNAFDYKIGGANNLEKIYHYFYDDAELFLGRKKAKFDEFMENR